MISAGDDEHKLKKKLVAQIKMKDLRKLKYFVGQKLLI